MILSNPSSRTIFHCCKCLIRRSQVRGACAPGYGVVTGGYSSSRRTKKYNTADAWIKPEGYDTGIQVYNSLTKRCDKLILPKGKNLSWYICGPTVYDSAHIGHASCYMRFDIIRRILQNFFDINVTYMMGITDIDDKIIRRANELDQEIDSITKHYEYEFFQELTALNISAPTLTSRVTGNIPEIIRFIQKILDRGHAYVGSDGSVYFDVEEYGNYQRFVPVNAPENFVSKVKKNFQDFALWKAAKPGEPYWDSPWGGGRPGWHIECSAMASEIFGTSIDVHSGGIDLMFPHHENELAQSCSYHGVKQWANYWLHAGHLHTPFDQEKMSKSLKNVVNIPELLGKYTPNQFRMFCMMSQHQSPLVYSDEEMLEAKGRDGQIRNFLAQCEAYVKGQITGSDIPEVEFMEQLSKTKDNMIKHFKDDFNTSAAMKNLFNLTTMVTKHFNESEGSGPVKRSPGTVAAVSLFVKVMCRKLGFQKAGWSASEGSADMKLRDVIDATVRFRQGVREFAMNADIPLKDGLSKKEMKKERNKVFADLYKQCDDLRTEMSLYKVYIQDRQNGSTWNFADRKHVQKTQSQEDQNNSDNTKGDVNKSDKNDPS